MSLKHESSKRLVFNQLGASTQQTIDLVVLNLMPNKLETEGQLLDLFAGLPENLTLTFLYPQTHHFKSPILPYLKTSYATLPEIADNDYDGLIITGAPVETLPYAAVDYWQEFTEILDWAQDHVRQNLFICWAAQAALYAQYGIEKYAVRPKVFGIFEHQAAQATPLLANVPHRFYMPHSRHTTLQSSDVQAQADLNLLVDDADVGPVIVQSRDQRQTFITGHPEYSQNTLAQEYQRDLTDGIPITLPENYFYGNDANAQVLERWHTSGQQIIANWLQQLN
ncbi:homoserine O-acetyltransferase/O-succinyltransferase family protein [Loigolactobacillus zhaoyuanensis]|uniref:Homoserine O-acetyltransferase n=1 Tax=Loigolactobacillus zhaoyuanensis TaxID=2486017 RepID=A0ABW8UDL1_9LACO|nr:homoserine O-succinyltransferase [Loigolactobacillus zhaoyuanensis]